MKYRAHILVFTKNGLPDVAALNVAAKLDEANGKNAFHVHEVRVGRVIEIKFSACDYCHACATVANLICRLDLFDENTESAELINISLDQSLKLGDIS